MLQEWVQTVGKSAGLSANNTRLSSGSVGVPESRLEVSSCHANAVATCLPQSKTNKLTPPRLCVNLHTLQMEVTFGSMAEFEQFLASIPYQQHKAWTQRIQSMVVDGSPVWQVSL